MKKKERRRVPGRPGPTADANCPLTAPRCCVRSLHTMMCLVAVKGSPAFCGRFSHFSGLSRIVVYKCSTSLFFWLDPETQKGTGQKLELHFHSLYGALRAIEGIEAAGRLLREMQMKTRHADRRRMRPARVANLSGPGGVFTAIGKTGQTCRSSPRKR